MKISFSLLITIIFAVGAYAQTTSIAGNVNLNRPVTVLPDTARYQLVPLVSFGATVVRLDRYTGKTYIYEQGRRKWFLLEVRGGLPAFSTQMHPRYEIYAESEGFNFLLNTETGQTWILNARTWEPVTD